MSYPKIDCGHAHTMVQEAKRLVMQTYPSASVWIFIEVSGCGGLHGMQSAHGKPLPFIDYDPEVVLEMSLDSLVYVLMQFADEAFVQSVPLVHRFPLDENLQH